MTDLNVDGAAAMSDEMTILRAQVRRFVEERIVPFGEAWEQAGKIPREIFRELGELGILGLRFPAEFGGSGLGAVASIIVAEELGRSTFGGVAASITVHIDMSVGHVANHGTDELKARYLPDAAAGRKIAAICITEPDAGSDVAGLKTRAIRSGDGWIINGAKTFITNGVYGDIYIVAARTDPDVKGSRGISLFVVDKDTPGLIVSRKLEKHGWRSSDTAELFFDDLRVPASALIGEEGKGFYYIMETFQNERLTIGGMCVGQCARALELTVEYAKQRRAFGKSLWDQPVIRNRLASLAAKTAAARALTYRCAELIDQGQTIVKDVSMLKAFATEITQEVLYACVQFHGGTGYMIGTAVERMSRDVRVLTIGGGATEIMLEEVAKRL